MLGGVGQNLELLVNSATAITIALITIVGGAALNFYFENKKLKEHNKNLKQEIRDITISTFNVIQNAHRINEIIAEIFHKTKADRFILFSGTNKVDNIRYVTAIMECHKDNPFKHLSEGALKKYAPFEPDAHYIEMLKNVKNTKIHSIDTSTMSESALKDIYIQEKVSYSKIIYLAHGAIDENKDRLFYCSIATHDDEPFTDEEKTIIRYCSDNLRYLLQTSILPNNDGLS